MVWGFSCLERMLQPRTLGFRGLELFRVKGFRVSGSGPFF